MKSYFEYPSPIGRIGIGEENGYITDIRFERSAEKPKDARITETPMIKEANRQLEEYFAGKRRKFGLPLEIGGTDFQRRCWKVLLDIPYGETRSYADIARAVGSPRGFRAVGMANNRNHIVIVIPCHRVIGSDGGLVGFGGGLDVKKYLLDMERGYAAY